jgi:hypothetical protein
VRGARFLYLGRNIYRLLLAGERTMSGNIRIYPGNCGLQGAEFNGPSLGSPARQGLFRGGVLLGLGSGLVKGQGGGGAGRRSRGRLRVNGPEHLRASAGGRFVASVRASYGRSRNRTRPRPVVTVGGKTEKDG